MAAPLAKKVSPQTGANDILVSGSREDLEMTAPVDPLHGLAARQIALTQGVLNLRPAASLAGLHACARSSDTGPVLCYILVEGKTVTAMVNFRPRTPIEGRPAYTIELAVPEDRRGSGRGKEAVGAAILELRHQLAETGIGAFGVEAIVETDNPASMRIAEQTISEASDPAVDLYSGKPARRFLRKLETKPTAG
jgi:hypothetical protein